MSDEDVSIGIFRTSGSGSGVDTGSDQRVLSASMSSGRSASVPSMTPIET